MKQWLLVLFLLGCAYALHVLNDHDELTPINLTQKDCEHGCYR